MKVARNTRCPLYWIAAGGEPLNSRRQLSIKLLKFCRQSDDHTRPKASVLLNPEVLERRHQLRSYLTIRVSVLFHYR